MVMLLKPLALCLAVSLSVALHNGLARTPPMGWMTWERFRCTAGISGTGPSCAADPKNCLDEQLVKQHADILAQPEWKAAGYNYVNIDDCWANWKRTAGGKLKANTTRFPHGMKALADYVHSKGVRLGTYNDMGTATCGKYPGECKDEVCTLPGYMSVDAATYAGWGIDSLKMDGCNSYHNHSVLDPAYEFMGAALNKTGRPMMYSCSWPDYIRTAAGGANSTVDYANTAKHCNIWRMYDDIQDDYTSMSGIADWVGDNAGNATHPGNGMRQAAGPGHFNDPDMLIIGNFALSKTQAMAQMALWSIMAAPLLMGNDLRDLDPEMKAILLATEVIKVDQDPMGEQGYRVAHYCEHAGCQAPPTACNNHDVWMRHLANGDIAVVLWNRGHCGTHLQLTATWKMLGLDSGKKYKVRDLFAKKDLGTFNKEYTAFVDIDGVVMVKLSSA